MVAIPQDLLPAFRLLFGANDVLPTSIDARSLKRVYRRRALDTHPDRARSTGADPAQLTRLFQEVNLAYDRLLEFIARSPGRVVPPSRPAPRPGPAPHRAAPAQGRPHAGAQARPRPDTGAGRDASAARERGAAPDPRAGASPRGAQGDGRPRGAHADARTHGSRDARADARTRGPKADAGARAQAASEAGSPSTGRSAPGARSGPAAGAAAPGAAPRPGFAGARSGPAAGDAAPGAAPPGASAGAGTSDHFWGGRLPNRPLLLGQFLYYSGRISFRALIGAIHWQRSQRPHFGQLAVQMGYLPPDLVHSLLLLKRFEERIGDAAVRMGILSQQQRDRLLSMQRVAQRPFGQYFVDAGLLHPEDLKRAVTGQFQHNLVRVTARSR